MIEFTTERASIAKEILRKAICNHEITSKQNILRADKINFKSNSERIIQTDQFGFIRQKPLNSPSKSEIEDRKKKLLQWEEILQNYTKYKSTQFKKLKQLTREGIPDNLRGTFWIKYAEVSYYHINGLYNQLVLITIPPTLESETTILKDLTRTFPLNSHFNEQYGIGQRSLFHVLSAYSHYNKEIGYVQGMSFIAALLLIYMDEENAFYCLHSIMKKYELEGFYLEGFPMLRKKFYVLLNLMKRFVPKVYQLLYENRVSPTLYASEWFITLFTRLLDFNVLVRIFDVFLLEGFKVIFRFTIAVMKIKQDEIIKTNGDLSSVMNVMKNLFTNIDTKELFEVGFSLYLSKDHIKHYEDEFEKVKGNKLNEFISAL